MHYIYFYNFLVWASQRSVSQGRHRQMNPETMQIVYSILAACFISCDNDVHPQTADLSQMKAVYPTARMAVLIEILSSIASVLEPDYAKTFLTTTNNIKLLSVWEGNNYRMNIKRHKIPWWTSVLHSCFSLLFAFIFIWLCPVLCTHSKG